MTTLQDSQGFVWLGTEDGLVRFDGHELHRYAHSRTETRLAARQLHLGGRRGRRHDLWIAIKDAGLARWNRAHRHVHGLSPRRERTRARSRATASAPCSSMRAAASGSARAMRASTFSTRPRDTSSTCGTTRDDPASLEQRSHLHARARSRRRRLDRHRRGLDRWDAGTRTLTRVGPPPGDAALAARQADLARARRPERRAVGRHLRRAASSRLDRDGRVLETFRHDAARRGLARQRRRARASRRPGRATSGSARRTGSSCSTAPPASSATTATTPNDSASLRDSFVMSLYQDAAGLVWIGTRTGGVSRWNPRSWELGGHRPAWLENQPVTAFADAPDNNVWIASLGGRARAVRCRDRESRRRSTRSSAARTRSAMRRVMSLRAGPPRRAVDRHDGQRR